MLKITIYFSRNRCQTEHGACGIAILAVEALMSFVVARRPRRGTGFDYWLTAIRAESV
jgi:hypothetical protein